MAFGLSFCVLPLPGNFSKLHHLQLNPTLPASSLRKRYASSFKTFPHPQTALACANSGDKKILFNLDQEGATNGSAKPKYVNGSATVRLTGYNSQPIVDVGRLQELLVIQQGPRKIGFVGSRNMGFMHQELIEILSYGLVMKKNHIFTSGGSGTNAAVIRGVLRAQNPELLTVILPQSLSMQSEESQELLSQVKYVIEKPSNDNLPFMEARRLCHLDIIFEVKQLICFTYPESNLLMEIVREARDLKKFVTLFYL